jgi:phage N-6-adenine-methyltransferase
MNSALMFSKASDEWATPLDVFEPLHVVIRFDLDVAATSTNAKCEQYLGPDHVHFERRDALLVPWALEASSCWMNPPYSQCKAFIA